MRSRGEGRPHQERATSRRLAPAVWTAGAVLLIITAFLTAQTRSERTALERWIADVLAPANTLVARADRRLTEALDNLARLTSLRRSYEQLLQENERLRLELAMLSGVAAENRELRRQLGLPDLPGYRLLAADVIRRDPSRWHSQVVINRGQADGVQPGMAAVAPGGAVGQVLNTTARTATVALLTDSRSAAGGVIVRTGELVLVEGTGSGHTLRVKALIPDSSFQPGDQVVASGLGGVYPRGVHLGTIREVRPGAVGLGREGLLEPGADISRVSYVYVVMPAPGQRRGGR